MIQDWPIGVFDSGVGGLSVFREIRKQLPDESLYYFADTGNCPYGSKREEDACALARESIRFLINRGCKLVVIACNTVTAVAIERFRQNYLVPFVGMEPAVKPAVRETLTGKVGVLATENTFKGRLFKAAYEKYSAQIDLVVQPGYGLVELVEQGKQDSDEARELLTGYLLPMIEKGVDTLVLGCTHYPFLKSAIREIAGHRLAIIDPAPAVARQVSRILKSSDLASGKDHPAGYRFYSTGEPGITETFVRAVMETEYRVEQVVID